MIIVGKLAYWPTPKCACSSVKMLLAQLDGKANEIGHGKKSMHHIYPTPHAFKWDEGRVRNCFKFVVVRDPLERFKSAWANRIGEHRDLPVSINKMAKELVLCRAQSNMIRDHTHLQSRHIGADLSRFDFVCPMERMGDLEEKISEALGQKVTIPHMNADKVETPQMDPAAVQAVVKFYASDYELLRQFYRKPV